MYAFLKYPYFAYIPLPDLYIISKVSLGLGHCLLESLLKVLEMVSLAKSFSLFQELTLKVVDFVLHGGLSISHLFSQGDALKAVIVFCVVQGLEVSLLHINMVKTHLLLP